MSVFGRIKLSMSWETYKEKLKKFSDRIVELQRPIRVLDSIKFPSSFDESFLKSKCKEVPKIDKDYYDSIPLGFDLNERINLFNDLIKEIQKELGPNDVLGKLMQSNCEEYIGVCKMLSSRGTKQFYEESKKLYGTPKGTFQDEKTKIQDLSIMMYNILSSLGDTSLGPVYPQNLTAQQTVEILNHKFSNYFIDDPVRARISDGIVADAAAGGDYVKIKDGSLFSFRDIQILEVHEGWVHVGTALNGQNQHLCKFIAKGPPKSAPTQEGLAVLMELFTFSTYPRRAKEINDRVIAVDKVEDGANFLELFEFYRIEGYSELDALNNCKRVFRGGLLEGGAPFTKDIAYIRGFIENYNFIRAAMRAGKPEYIPFLFVGKIHSSEVPLYYHKYKEGLIDPPKYLPNQFKDLNGVAVWMSFSNVFNMIDMQKVQEHFEKIF